MEFIRFSQLTVLQSIDTSDYVNMQLQFIQLGMHCIKQQFNNLFIGLFYILFIFFLRKTKPLFISNGIRL
jgi:hypothetical protein